MSANQKEYQMKFSLDAKTSSGFSSQFKAAQAQLASMQREVDALHKTESDVTAFQKQQAAVEATTKKLGRLEAQEQLLTRQIEEYKAAGESTTALEREQLKLAQRIEDTGNSLTRQESKLLATSERLEEAGIDTEHLSEAEQKLGQQMEELHHQQDEVISEMEKMSKSEEDASNSSKSFGTETVSAFEAMADAIIAVGIIDKINDIKDSFIDCVNVAGEFQFTMSTVEALSGSTASEMAALSAEAKELGANSTFSAYESAQAMTYMGMAGWDATDMLQGMTGVLNLAAASGEDLAITSDIVTDSLTAFGLKASDTGHYADILAQAATNANTNVSMMGETFKYAAPVAGALGFTVEDTAVQVGLLANAGIKGSQAGTTLRTIMSTLAGDIEIVHDDLAKTVITTKNTDGSMRDLADILADCRTAWADLSESERAANAESIMGKNAMSGWLSLMSATEDDVSSLTDAIDNCNGAAERMASIKLDNMKGSLTLMQSAWEGLTISVGEKFTDDFATVYDMGAKIFSLCTKIVDANPGLVRAVAAFTAVVGTATAGIVAFSAASKVVAALNLASLFASPVAPIAAVAVGLTAVTAAVAAFTTASRTADSEVAGLTASSRKQYYEVQELKKSYEDACSQYGSTSEEALRLKYRLDDLNGSFESNKRSLADFTASIDASVSNYDQMVASFDANTSSIDAESISTLALIQKLQDLTSASDDVTASQTEIQAVIDALNEKMPSLGLSIEDVTNNASDMVEQLKKAAEAQAEQEMAQEKQREYIELLKQSSELERQREELLENIRIEQERINSIKGPDETAAFEFPGIEQSGEIQAYTKELNDLNSRYEDCTVRMQEITGEWETQASTVDDATATVAEFSEQMDSLVDAYDEAYTAAQKSIDGQFKLWEDVSERSTTSISEMNAALDSQLSYWNDYTESLENLHGRNIDGLSVLVGQMNDGSKESAAALQAMSKASDEELSAMVAKYDDVIMAEDNAAVSIADMQVNFSNGMQSIREDMEQAVKDMKKENEAAAAGSETMQAYIDALNSKGSTAVETARKWAAQAAAALKANIPKGSTSVAQYEGFASGTDSAPAGWAWVGENGPELAKLKGGEQILTTEESADWVSAGKLNAYATGTNSAKPGLSLVGEEGPELMMMGGGEKVVNADNTQSVIDSILSPIGINAPSDTQNVNINFSFNPSYNISGNSDSIMDTIQRSAGDMKDYILEVLDSYFEDNQRRAFA